MHSLSNLISYFSRNKHFFTRLIVDLTKILWFKLTRKKIVVITTGSGGIGDYLWIRSFYSIIKENNYKIVLIAMSNLKETVESFDKNDLDIIRYFESCIQPKKIEILFFKFFYADVYLNFCKECIAQFVKYKVVYTNTSDINYNWFYEERNNAVFSQFLNLPIGFHHNLPNITPTKETQKLSAHPYVVLTEGGNTHGKLNDIQLIKIIQHLYNLNYNIFFNGNIHRLSTIISKKQLTRIIDGYSFPFPQYVIIIKKADLVITVNTSIYHFALLLNRPCVIITPYEPRTVKLNNPNQVCVFNDKHITDMEQRLKPKTNDEKQRLLENTKTEMIIDAIDKILSHKELTA